MGAIRVDATFGRPFSETFPGELTTGRQAVCTAERSPQRSRLARCSMGIRAWCPADESQAVHECRRQACGPSGARRRGPWASSPCAPLLESQVPGWGDARSRMSPTHVSRTCRALRRARSSHGRLPFRATAAGLLNSARVEPPGALRVRDTDQKAVLGSRAWPAPRHRYIHVRVQVLRFILAGADVPR